MKPIHKPVANRYLNEFSQLVSRLITKITVTEDNRKKHHQI